MRITRLEITDFKRIFAVDISPDGAVVIVGGENKAGKTSTLDSIEAGLRGKRYFPTKPIRDGAEKATIRITLSPDEDDQLERALVATRIITESRQYFEVKYEDGSKPAGTPQAIMDDLLGAVAFDFMDFLNLKPKPQLELLKEIVGLDFSELDLRRQNLYDDRTILGRDIKKIEGSIAMIPDMPDVSDEEVSVEALMEELKVGRGKNNENLAKRYELQETGKEWTELDLHVKVAEEELKRVQEDIARHKQLKNDVTIRGEELKKEVDALEDVDLEPIETQIRESNETNINIRKKQEKKLLAEELAGLNKTSKEMTDQIQAIDDNKLTQIAEAKFPVPGLGFGEGIVMFKDQPLDQASDAEQIEVGIGIGASLHPKLAVMLIRAGEKITPTTMKDVICPLAEEKGLQLFIEDCRAGKEATLIIEAGRIKEGGTECLAKG